jgi:hypothetical protein
MPNIDAAFGLRPINMLGSGANTNGVVKFAIQTASEAGIGSSIYQGSPVIPLSTGLIGLPANANGGTVPLLGAFIGCEYTDLLGTPTYSNRWPGTSAVKSGTAAFALVAAHPDQLFAINCDAAAGQDLVHANANFATAITGNNTTGMSAGELAVSTAQTTNTLNMRVVGFEELPSSSDTAVAGRIAIVLLNNHFYRYNANGTGAGI